MGYKLIESKKSKIQLEELVRYLLFKIESSQAAEHLLKEVKEVYQRLEENPEQSIFLEVPPKFPKFEKIIT